MSSVIGRGLIMFVLSEKSHKNAEKYTRHALVHVTQVINVDETKARRINVRVIDSEPHAGTRAALDAALQEPSDYRVDHSWRMDQSHGSVMQTAQSGSNFLLLLSDVTDR